MALTIIQSSRSHCDICCVDGQNSHLSLIKLQKPEQLLIEKLFEFLHTCIISQSSLIPKSNPPEIACQLCLKKVYVFKSLLKQIIIKRANIVAPIALINARLRSHIVNSSEMQQDDDDDDQRHYDRFNCKCQECQRKYGGLPLLADVIERESRREEEQPSTSAGPGGSTARNEMRCNDCGKMFTHRGDLHKHQRRHTGEQPYTCTVCRRRFAHTSNLNRHMMLHSGERPFRCDQCQKTFARKDKLDEHQRGRSCGKK